LPPMGAVGKLRPWVPWVPPAWVPWASYALPTDCATTVRLSRPVRSGILGPLETTTR